MRLGGLATLAKKTRIVKERQTDSLQGCGESEVCVSFNGGFRDTPSAEQRRQHAFTPKVSPILSEACTKNNHQRQ
jgi:hypothetical protein